MTTATVVEFAHAPENNTHLQGGQLAAIDGIAPLEQRQLQLAAQYPHGSGLARTAGTREQEGAGAGATASSIQPALQLLNLLLVYTQVGLQQTQH